MTQLHDELNTRNMYWYKLDPVSQTSPKNPIGRALGLWLKDWATASRSDPM